MKHTAHGVSVAALALSLTTSLSSVALAQDAPGLRGTLSFAQTLELSDNPDFVADPDGGALVSRTALGFVLDSATRTETFRLSLGTLIEGEFGNATSDDFEFVRDTAALTYVREGATARLSLGATYSDTERDDQEIELDFDPDALIIDGGSVERIGLTAGLDLGVGGPLGLELDARYGSTEYVGTSDADLEDSTTYGVDALATFRLNPALTGRALAGFSRTREDDATDTTRTRRYVGFGLAGQTAGGLSFSSDVTFDEVETETNAPSSVTENGLGFNVSVTQDRPNGSIGARFSSRVDESGRLTRASVNRNLDLRDGALNFSLGVIDPDDDDLRPVASIGFQRDTARGAVSANLSQTPVSDDGDTVLNTAIRLNYSEAINSVSGWSAGLSYSEANRLGAGEDTSRTTASVSYRRDLTEDWDMRAGYSYSQRAEDGEADRSENALFLSLERDFSFGF